MTFSRKPPRSRGEGFAETHADGSDPRLRGRTYSIPFEDVWQAALQLVTGGLKGCTVQRANDRDGIIIAEARRGFPRGIDDFTVSVTLDDQAQTRVDARSIARTEGRDWGANARRLIRFFEQLDARVAESYRRRLGQDASFPRPAPHAIVPHA
ncbi:MAG: DUF1499 domain-containing protein [Gemmatimonadetes bacterium]|nr:DUF1499 domain-containing protein [Gemmatimonadota bacterium]